VTPLAGPVLPEVKKIAAASSSAQLGKRPAETIAVSPDPASSPIRNRSASGAAGASGGTP
jgi:hypothetical protein